MPLRRVMLGRPSTTALLPPPLTRLAPATACGHVWLRADPTARIGRRPGHGTTSRGSMYLSPALLNTPPAVISVIAGAGRRHHAWLRTLGPKPPTTDPSS